LYDYSTLCLATRLPHLEEGPVTKKKTALEEEGRESPGPTLNVATTMNVIQAGGEGKKMTMIDAPGAMITVEERTVVTATAIIEALIATGTEVTMTGTVGAKVETAKSYLVALRPRSVRLLANALTAYAAALAPSLVLLQTRPNPTLLIPGC